MYLYRIFELDENSIKTNVFSDINIENCLNYKVNKFKINFDDLLNNKMVRNKDETWTLFEKKRMNI